MLTVTASAEAIAGRWHELNINLQAVTYTYLTTPSVAVPEEMDSRTRRVENYS